MRTAERFFTKLSVQTGHGFPEPSWTHPEFSKRWARRIRYQYHVHKDGRVNAGLYRPDRVTLENIEDCAVAVEPLGLVLPELREALNMYSLYGTGQIVVAIDDDPKEKNAVICIRAEDGHFPDKDWFRALSRRDWPVRGLLILDREYRERYRWGKASYVPMAGAKVGRRKIKSTVGVPIEDGPEVLAATYRVLEEWLSDLAPDSRVLELFAGVGIFTSLLHKNAGFVDAVTTPAWAIDDLHANFEKIEKEKVRRTYASMARGLAKPYRKPDLYDLICAWAPQRGAIGLWPTLKETQAPQLITSHADLLKSAPDLKRILKVGYRPVAVHAIESEANRMRCTLLVRWILA
jgi:tRNA/tmRNA/rRNA uracil-C5-methylase (TrmA/RlmC/RlmD family)